MFTSIIDEQIRCYIPVKRIKSGPNSNREFPFKLDKEVLEVFLRKRNIYREMHYHLGTKVRDESIIKWETGQKKFIRKARKDYEHSMAKKAKENPKVVWRYINSKSKTRVGICELCKTQRTRSLWKPTMIMKKPIFLQNYLLVYLLLNLKVKSQYWKTVIVYIPWRI